jgi:hypothetical protein
MGDVTKAFDRYLELVEAVVVSNRVRAELDKSFAARNTANSVYLEEVLSLSDKDQDVLRAQIDAWKASAAGLAYLSEL